MKLVIPSTLAAAMGVSSLFLFAACNEVAIDPIEGDDAGGSSSSSSSSGSVDPGTDAGEGDAGREPVTLTILQTSDLHTNVMPWDYFTAKVDEKRGLAKVATLVAQERAAAGGCSLLVDTGDTIQGSPLGAYYGLVDNAPEHPMAVAMRTLGYDAMALGNHEFNYGQPVLQKFIGEAGFPVLGANVRKTADDSEAFTPYVIKEKCGVKVGILGMVTPGVTTWERAENIAGLSFANPIEIAQKYVPQMRAEGADVVLVAFHSGPDKQPVGSTSDPAVWLTDYSTWTDRGSLPNENLAVQIAEQVPGVDAVLSGHTHQPIPKMLINGVVISQPNRWGSHLSKISIKMDRKESRWTVASTDSQILPVDATVAPDPAIVAAVQTYHDATLAYVETPIGTAAGTFYGGYSARFTDSPLADLINEVQEDAAEDAGHPVDFSITAIFTDGVIPAGQIKLRDAYSVYIYDNTLYVMEINGSILRRALEKNAEYFAQLNPAALPATPKECKASADSPEYNWDIYSKIEYELDATKPVGSRVTSLKFQGVDVTDAQPFTIALNNYRAGGGGSFDMFKEGTIVWTSADGVRDYVADYVTAHPNLNPATVSSCNFSLLPDLYTPYFTATNGPAACQP